MTSDPRHPTVLVVDDDPDTCELYSFMLGGVGYSVVTAGTVSAAASVVKRQVPQVVLTDWRLPDGDGLAVAAALYAHSAARGVPLVGVTGVSMSSDAVADLNRQGFISILLKPAAPDDILRAVHGASEIATARRLRSAAQRLRRYAACALREVNRASALRIDTAALVCRAAEKSGEHITLTMSDDAAHYVAAAGSARDLTGYDPEEFLSLSVADLLPAAVVSSSDAAAQLERPAAHEGRLMLRRRDGVPVQAQYCCIPNVLPGLHASALAAAIEVPASL